jgi:osmotically-inducible protein OsmY
MSAADQLARRIEHALLKDHRVSGQRVHVSVDAGIVTLRGSVQSHRRKLIAQEVAASFRGCGGVDNQLEVVPAERVGDEAIAAHVRSALEAHPDVTKETIAVAVEGGVVTLGGTVGKPWERVLAEDITLGVRGVREVRNLVLVDAGEQEEDKAMSRAIAAALAEARGPGDSAIRVAVSGGRVVLSGSVDELWQKEVAVAVAGRFQPRWIADEITVTGRASPE